MSAFSLTLVLQFQTSKIIHDIAKISIKSEKLTPFGGIFHVRELFSRYVGSVIDKELGLRCPSFGYQYSEIERSLITAPSIGFFDVALGARDMASRSFHIFLSLVYVDSSF